MICYKCHRPSEVTAIGTEAGPIVMPAPGKPGRN